MADVEEAGLHIEFNTPNKERGDNLVLDEFQATMDRRFWMFWGVVVFLVFNALVFFALLFWAFCIVAYGGGNWHLLGFAALPGVLLATIAIMALRAVYNIGGKEGAAEMSSMLQTIQSVRGDLSS